jgi:hypothetical protein
LEISQYKSKYKSININYASPQIVDSLTDVRSSSLEGIYHRQLPQWKNYTHSRRLQSTFHFLVDSLTDVYISSLDGFDHHRIPSEEVQTSGLGHIFPAPEWRQHGSPLDEWWL